MDKRVWILDGAMGTTLQAGGLEPELASLRDPDALYGIHRAYIESGAEIICANTFVANRYKLAGSGHGVAEVISSAVGVARRAANGGVLVALDIGPLGRMMEPSGTLSFEEAYDIYREIITAGRDAGADIVFFETMSDLYELKAGILAAKEHCELPIFASMSFEGDGRTFMGCSLSEAAAVLEGLGVDALGLNCSIGPRESAALAVQLCGMTRLPVILKPNAGLPDPSTNTYDCDPVAFADAIQAAVEGGVAMVGGCCGTTPEHIRELARRVKGSEPVRPARRVYVPRSVVTSGTKTVNIDGVRIIGERINPTGKKRLRVAIESGDYDYILTMALDQLAAGADILDVNVSVPRMDEPAVMSAVVKRLQGVVDAPLQLDSPNADALEAGLRAYNGKPIVNSVNGEAGVLERILPAVKKYGAAVVGLTLDERGIPDTAAGRLEIAARIVEKAAEHHIPREDVYIDCLTLTTSARPQAARETLDALRLIKDELGVKTLLGVSNISFGLPERELLNAAFLTMALYAGLDLPIINPGSNPMTAAIDAFNALTGRDVGARVFISRHSAAPERREASQETDQSGMDLIGAVLGGLKENSGRIAGQMLKDTDGMDLIDNHLIKALDMAGDRFDKGEFFLPQLLQAAAAAGHALEIVKAGMKGSSDKASKGRIILATVKGDIHDIGKNIVKLLLQNYGYDIIDLGRDVPPETIVRRALDEDIRMVGLSALMTTTLGGMEESIRALRESGARCKVAVGGAVVTGEYARLIGADYYARDAKSAVKVAKEIFDN